MPVSPADRDRIAHGNAEQLLRMTALHDAVAPDHDTPADRKAAGQAGVAGSA
jgi:hypothetical protein